MYFQLHVAVFYYFVQSVFPVINNESEEKGFLTCNECSVSFLAQSPKNYINVHIIGVEVSSII